LYVPRTGVDHCKIFLDSKECSRGYRGPGRRTGTDYLRKTAQKLRNSRRVSGGGMGGWYKSSQLFPNMKPSTNAQKGFCYHIYYALCSGPDCWNKKKSIQVSFHISIANPNFLVRIDETTSIEFCAGTARLTNNRSLYRHFQ